MKSTGALDSGAGLFEERKFTVMSTRKNQNIKRTTYWLCITAVFMALNVAMSSFGVPVPGGHLYMNDIIIGGKRIQNRL